MTAALDAPQLEWADALGTPCECTRRLHHPNYKHCGQQPKFAARIVHHGGCNSCGTFMLCADCLDEAKGWAQSIIGRCCSGCGKHVRKMSDLIGPVVAL